MAIALCQRESIGCVCSFTDADSTNNFGCCCKELAAIICDLKLWGRSIHIETLADTLDITANTFIRRCSIAVQCITFPTYLRCLSFGCCFNQPLQGVTFPTSLRTLFIGGGLWSPRRAACRSGDRDRAYLRSLTAATLLATLPDGDRAYLRSLSEAGLSVDVFTWLELRTTHLWDRLLDPGPAGGNRGA